MMMSSQVKWCNVEGVNTRYFESGTGEPVLLLPGGTIGAGAASIAQTWDRNFDALASRYRVLVLDKLGQGHTDNPLQDSDYTKSAKLRHIADFMAALRLPPAHVVGQSRGGFLAALLTLRFPHLVASCTIVNSSTLAPGVGLTHLLTGGSCPYPRFSRESQRWLFETSDYSADTVDDTIVEEGYKVMQLPKYQESFRKMWEEGLAFRYYYPDEIRLRKETYFRLSESGMQRPTQIIWGDKDKTASPDRAIALYQLIAARQRHVGLNVFTAAGHHPYRDHPKYFNELMLGFLGQVSGAHTWGRA